MKEIKFDKRASKYDESFEGRLSERFYRSLVNTVDLKIGFCVLDVGCGTGTILYRLSKKETINGYGIDVSEAMLNEARQKCPQMSFRIGDSAALPFEDNSFDAVTACMAYHHFPSQKGVPRGSVPYPEAARAALYLRSPIPIAYQSRYERAI